MGICFERLFETIAVPSRSSTQTCLGGVVHSYTKDGFTIEEHQRLAKTFKDLSEQGVYCILTNHNTEFIRDLYDGFNLYEVDVKRMINRDSSKRTGKELIITNFE